MQEGASDRPADRFSSKILREVEPPPCQTSAASAKKKYFWLKTFDTALRENIWDPLGGFLFGILNCGLASKHHGTSNYCFETSHHHKQGSKNSEQCCILSQYRVHKYTLVPPPQAPLPKPRGFVYNNSQKSLKRTQHFIRCTAKGRNHRVKREQFASWNCLLHGGSRTYDWLPPPVSEEMLGFHSPLSEKVAQPRTAASRQDPRLRLRDVNASVCTVTLRAALSGVMTANTVG